MKFVNLSIAAFGLVCAAGCSTPEPAPEPAPAPAPVAAPAPAPAPVAAAPAAPNGEMVVSTVEATAVVKSIDHATREVTLTKDDGTEVTFIAGADVTNLPQVKPGDVLHVVYGEAIAYEVKKGGTTMEPVTSVAGSTAEPGKKPAGGLARQVTATVLITAIDPTVPSVTFKGPKGNVRTIRVQRPEKLVGVNVGDTVQLTYTEALAIKVEAPPAK